MTGFVERRRPGSKELEEETMPEGPEWAKDETCEIFIMEHMTMAREEAGILAEGRTFKVGYGERPGWRYIFLMIEGVERPDNNTIEQLPEGWMVGEFYRPPVPGEPREKTPFIQKCLVYQGGRSYIGTSKMGGTAKRFTQEQSRQAIRGILSLREQSIQN